MKRKASTDGGARVKAQRSEESDTNNSEDEDDVMDMSQNPDFNLDKEADVGVIEKVSLKNFMCHNRLVVPFGANINFVVGRNGSGKSAVVTAMVVGLGGKASATSRGSKLRSFIKTGKHSAEVEITLRNRGIDSFRHELYGDSIIVQRQFKSDGSTQYRLKSKEGKVVSQKREDLNQIIDQFNIQVDNPVAILNQDTSRNFLNSKSPQDKYKFFLKATQLEQIKDDYSRADEQKVVTTDIIQRKVMTLPKLEKEVFSWEQKFKSLTAVEELKAKTKRLKNEMAWAFVIGKERELQPLEKEMKQEEARLPRFKQKADSAKTSLDTINIRMTELTSKLNASGEDVKALQPAHQEAKKLLKDQKTLARTAQNEVKRLEGAVSHTKKERNSIIERIKELQSSARHDYEAERQARVDKIAALQERLTGVEAQELTTDHQLDQFRGAITKYKNDQYKLGQDAQHCQTQLEKQQRNLQALKGSQGNKLRRFGAYMPQLVHSIEEYDRLGKFHKRPIGPLGAYMSLRDQKWALAVECCLKGLMNSFCCHDFHDEKLLEQIISSSCPPHFKPTIIVSKFKDNVYDVTTKGAQSDTYPTLFSVIHSDHPMVYNTLIDQRTVECVILIDDGKEARKVMDPDSRPGPPKNSREAFTMRGDQVYSAPTFRYYSSNQDTVKYLTSSVEEDIASLTNEIAQLKTQLDAIKRQRTQLDRDVQTNRQEERKTEAQLMKIREAKRKLTMEITELKNIEDPAPVDVATYEEEVRVLEGQLTSQSGALEAKMAVFQEENAKVQELDTKFKEIEAQMRAKIEAGDNIKDEVGNVVNEIETCKSTKKHYDAKLKEQEKKVKDLKDTLDKKQADIQVDAEKASQIHAERINTRRTPANLESEINQINNQIRNEEKQRGDPDEITNQYHEKKEAYRKIKKEVMQLQNFIKQLYESLESRKKAYLTIRNSVSFRVRIGFALFLNAREMSGKLTLSHKRQELLINRLNKVVTERMEKFAELRRYLAMRMKYFFIVFLNNRQYSGQLKFNHQTESLVMSVQPGKSGGGSGDGGGAKDLKSLSGGERSFSTVCFILALWDAMESPFRCLDEFDIFMDMVNRRISMEMMLEAAYSQTDRQFIFLSPLNMSHINIKDQKRVRIFKMPTPERNQGIIDFGERHQDEEEEHA